MNDDDWNEVIHDWQLDNRHRFYVPFDAIWAITVLASLVAGIVIGALVW